MMNSKVKGFQQFLKYYRMHIVLTLTVLYGLGVAFYLNHNAQLHKQQEALNAQKAALSAKKVDQLEQSKKELIDELSKAKTEKDSLDDQLNSMQNNYANLEAKTKELQKKVDSYEKLLGKAADFR